ncbi:MAG: gliding motility-associated C-terminal domain-containing protein [Saprospiraceae bacterium]|nr:gliding motility-associated C-terminal domain-containing protein [Saprospiraceae bacterium]
MNIRKFILISGIKYIWIQCLLLLTTTLNEINAQINCCCGSPTELNFSGLDFEVDPFPPPAGYFYYFAVSPLGPWTVSNGIIDHGDPNYCGGLAYGNPNGASYFVDLFGSAPNGHLAGTLQYQLTGLTPGNTYYIEFWYATYNGIGNYSANLSIANGAWLNVNWTANNVGNAIWLKKTYSFKALSNSASLEFTDTGASSPTYDIGMLLDDIKIFECPADQTAPVVLNPPTDLEIECEKLIPTRPQLQISDDCDLNPTIVLEETTDGNDPCNKTLTRNWTITDDCNNSTQLHQIIKINDIDPPDLIKLPEDKFVNCIEDVVKEFNHWIQKNGYAQATEDCGILNWRINYDRLPKNVCDTLIVEFITSDVCGNESSAYAQFIVRDTIAPNFIIEPVDKIYGNINNPRDSLKEWLLQNGYSKVSGGCDSVKIRTDFNGDSTTNPLGLWFYAEDDCGHVDSSFANFSYQGNSINCCCGVPTELFFSNLDFESPPTAPPGGWIDYSAGEVYAGWTITSGSVSIHDPAHLNLGDGNPNGSTQHMDLHGFSQGSAAYTLTGLTAGNKYTISFWYAIHIGGGNVSASLRIGNLLNVNWNASNPGNVNWLQAMYEFTANGPVATMEFFGSGSSPCCGMLIDDIQIFECPEDLEGPEILTALDDLEVECTKDVPKAPTIVLSDNCDANPKVSFKEVSQMIDPCTQKITRSWEVKDACGNITIEEQIIDVIDKNAPQFNLNPANKIIYCDQNINKEFNDWIKINGGAVAVDACGPVTWRTSIDKNPEATCDSVIVEFFAKDHCGNEASTYALFYVRDTSTPRFIVSAQNKNLICVPAARDSLKMWIDSFAFAKTTGDCDTVILSHNFNGDFNQNPMRLTVYAKDRCGNTDSSSATFTYRTGSDTFRIIEYSCNFTANRLDTAYFTSNGCDSIVISEKIKLFPDSLYIQNFTCDTLLAGFDTLILTNVSGCDSIVFTHTDWKSSPITLLQVFDCHFPAYRVDTMFFQGQFCDSSVITEYIPLKTDTTFLQLSTCDSTKVGIQTQILKNVFGCDSSVITHTLLSTVQTHFQNSFECGLALPYTDTLVYQSNSCDSLVITSHFPLKLDTTLLQNQTCDPMQSGVFQRKLINQSGCDSLVIEQVTLLPSDSINQNSSTCILSQAGIFTDRLKNRFGCDSIVRRFVQFIPSDTSVIQAFTCDPLSVRNDTLIYQTSTCDSVVFRSIQLSASDTIDIQLSTCIYSQSGFDTLRLTNHAGCDSLVFIHTTFIPSDTLHINATTCNPQLAGLDTLSLRNSDGCDSLVYISSTFLPINLLWTLDSIRCFGADDGAFHILNTGDFTRPFEIYLNGNLQSGNPTLDHLSEGNYSVYIRDLMGCISQTVQFELFNPTALVTDLGADQTAKKGSPVKINLQTNKNLQQIIWQPNHPNACVNCADYDFIADQDVWVYSLAIDDRGCNSLDSVFIKVLRTGNVFAPNVFSPNGDNINDYFYLTGDPDITIELLQIYDRWGELLFESKTSMINQATTGWDGSFKSKKLNPGVFLFVADVLYPDGSNQILKGDLSLIR